VQLPIGIGTVTKTGDEFLITISESQLMALVGTSAVTFYNGGTPAVCFDFDVNQHYRAVTRYTVCNNPVRPYQKKRENSYINNLMYLSGNGSPSLGSMPNTQEAMYNGGSGWQLGLFNGCPSWCVACTVPVIDQNFANSFQFYCEGRSANFELLSVFELNNTTYQLDNVYTNPLSTECSANIQVNQLVKFNESSPLTNTFPYEVKIPNIDVSEININKPSGWNWNIIGSNIDASLSTFSCNNFNISCGYLSNPYALSITAANNQSPLSINYSGVGFQIIDQNQTGPTLTTPFSYDEFKGYRVTLRLKPESPSCSSLNNYTATSSDCSIKFTSSSTPAPTPCGTSYESTKNNQNTVPSTLVIGKPSPNLQLTQIVPIPNQIITNQLTWQFVLENVNIPGGITPAKNIFFSIDPTVSGLPVFPASPNFTWEVNNLTLTTPGGSTQTYTGISLSQGNNLWLLGSNPELLANGTLTGELVLKYTDCSTLPDNFDLYWGWNCQVCTTTVVGNADICEIQSVQLEIEKQTGSLAAFNIYTSPTSYTACSSTPVLVTAEFKNLGLTDLIPQTVTVSGQNLSSNPTLSIGQFPPSPPIDFNTVSQIGTSQVWSIGSSLSNPSLKIGEGISFTYEMAFDGCFVGNQPLPIITVTGVDICGTTFTTSSPAQVIPSSGNSICNDCYSIYKYATAPTAIVGEPFTWNITVCGNNNPINLPSNTTVVETYPINFIPISPSGTNIAVNNIPPQGCVTVTVQGAFNDIGSCTSIPNTLNTATITGTNISATACVDVICPPTVYDEYILSNTDAINFLSQYNSGIYNKSIYIADFCVLNINSDFQFKQCTIMMGSGAEINVNISRLDIDETTISSCPYMWKGIKLAQGSKLFINDSEIRDAENAVFAEENTHISIIGSKIYDCVTGLITNTHVIPRLENYTGTVYDTEFGKAGLILKKEYPANGSQLAQPPHGFIGRAGISLRDVSSFKIGENSKNQNTFFNLNFGIDLKNANTEITNCHFTDIRSDLTYKTSFIQQLGAAVYADNLDYGFTNLKFRPLISGNNTIKNSDIGLFNRLYNVDVNRVSMDNVNVGIRATKNGACINTISSCEIHSNITGLHWYDNDWAKRMVLTNSSIFNSKRRGQAIILDEFSSGNNANYKIISNPILKAEQGGIVLLTRNVNKAEIGYNNIEVNDPLTYNQKPQSGIVLGAGERNNIYCNSTNTNIPHFEPNSYGIYVSQSPNNIITCNDVNNATKGVFFGGDCKSTQLTGNALVETAVGLYLNGQAVIGLQAHHGNRWLNINPNSTTAYKAPGQAGPLLSEFRIHTQNLPFWPQSITPSSGWFFFDPGSTFFDCVTTNSCVNFVNDPADDQAKLAAERLIAAESIEFLDYNDEMQTILQTRLYESIRRDSSLYLTDPVFVDFYSKIIGSPSGEISNVGLQLAKAMAIDSISYSTLATTNSLIGFLLDSINYVDSVNRINPNPANDILRVQFSQQISNLRNVAISILAAHAINVGLVRDSLLLVNATIQPTKLPDINQHSIYQILGEYHKKGDSVIYSNYNTLFAIAQQCPYAGGPAVFIARGLLRVVNDSLEYYDDVVCLQAGYYRTSNSTNSKEQKIKLQPNPTKDKLEVYAMQANEMPCPVEIFNSIGEMIYAGMSEMGVLLKTIDVSSFSPGLYSLRVKLDGKFYIEKLVIIK
jgi:hypothetical protein